MKDEKLLQDILETAEFIRDHAASKEDLAEVRCDMATNISTIRQGMATKEELHIVKDEIMNHIDGFIGLHGFQLSS